MPQAALTFAALCAAFLLFITARGELATYIRLLV